MSANHEAVELIDQARVARLSAGDCEIRSSAAIDAPQLPHLFAAQPAKRSGIEQREQLFQALPGGFMVVDESIAGHNRLAIAINGIADCQLPIADCQLPIADLRFD